MTNVLQILLGLALVNYFMFDVVSGEAQPTTKSAMGDKDKHVGPGLLANAGSSGHLKKALMIAGTTAGVFLLTLVSSAAFEKFVLFRFTNSVFSILLFVVILTGVLQVVSPLLAKRYVQFATLPGILLPLLFANCIVIGITMPVRTTGIALNEIFVSGFLRCAGFALVLVFFTVFRERLTGANIPAAFQGAPATLLAAALVSMTFMGFAGLA